MPTRLEIPLASEQAMLRDATRRFVSTAWSPVAAREVHNTESDPLDLRQAAELGWFAMLAPEELGGGSVSTSGIADAAVIGYEQGRHLVPGPFISTNVVVDALSRAPAGDDRRSLVRDLVAGWCTATWVDAGSGAAVATGNVTASRVNGRTLLRGTAPAVQDATTVDWFLVTAQSAEGLDQFVVPRDASGLSTKSQQSLDITRRFGAITFDDVEAGPALEVAPGAGAVSEQIQRQIDIASVLTIADMVGAMDHDFDAALEHARTRTAFGRPIGSFQALKHLLADTSLLLEASKAMMDAAVRAVAGGAAGHMLVSTAKAYVADSAISLGQDCFQVFGGIGFSWEHDQHLYLRRLTTDASLFGDASWHRRRLLDWDPYAKDVTA
jgi:alkylation response protein AidB-like acyl-CoA dehydrogenase